MDEKKNAEVLEDSALDAVSGGLVIDTDEIQGKINQEIGRIIRSIMTEDSKPGPLSDQTAVNDSK